MSLLNQQSGKGKKKGDQKKGTTAGKGQKTAPKGKSVFVSKQSNTGSQRGS